MKEVKFMHGEVKVWYMTEEERLEYIEKHPIRPTPEAKRRKEKGIDHISMDWSWAGKRKNKKQ